MYLTRLCDLSEYVNRYGPEIAVTRSPLVGPQISSQVLIDNLAFLAFALPNEHESSRLPYNFGF